MAKSLEARVTALDIILAYTSTTEHRKLFETTEVCKELLRLLPDQEHMDQAARVKVLQCLINFSQDAEYIKKMTTVSCAQRIYDLLKDNVKQDLQ